MTFDEIMAEADKFFEWPDDSRDVVTLTSAVLFAQQIAEKAAAKAAVDGSD